MRSRVEFRLVMVTLAVTMLQALAICVAHADSTADLIPVNYIIGGEFVDQADPIATTTVALVTKTEKGYSICTGSIVAQDLVVTAGHCLGHGTDTMRVVFRTSLSGQGPVMGVVAGVRHPNYGKGEGNRDQNDIALIRLNGTIPAGYTVATLLQHPEALFDGAVVTLAGYGAVTGRPAPGQSGSGTLRRVEVQIRDTHYGRSEVALDQSQGRGACHGDSGGPAFVQHDGQFYLWGVTSRGLMAAGGQDECSTNVVYTNVLAQMDFLRAAAQYLRQGPAQQPVVASLALTATAQ